MDRTQIEYDVMIVAYLIANKMESGKYLKKKCEGTQTKIK